MHVGVSVCMCNYACSCVCMYVRMYETPEHGMTVWMMQCVIFITGSFSKQYSLYTSYLSLALRPAIRKTERLAAGEDRNRKTERLAAVEDWNQRGRMSGSRWRQKSERLNVWQQLKTEIRKAECLAGGEDGNQKDRMSGSRWRQKDRLSGSRWRQKDRMFGSRWSMQY